MVDIIPMTYDYIDSYAECFDSIARERRWLSSFHAPPRYVIEKFTQSMIAMDAPFLIARDGHRVVGWCDIRRDARIAFHHVGAMGMGVHQDFRRKGVGTRLLEKAIARAVGVGIKRVELEVFAHNQAAIALYERAGFRHEGTKIAAACLDDGYVDVQMMAKLIAPIPS